MKLKIACVVVVGLSMLFFLCGFSTIHWRVATNLIKLHQGLWRSCSDDYGCAAITGPKPWLRAVQVIESLGLGCIVLSFVLMCVSFVKNNTKYIVVHFIASYTTACVIFLGLVIYGTKCEWEDQAHFTEGHSFYLTFVSGVGFIITSLLNIAQYNSEQNKSIW